MKNLEYFFKPKSIAIVGASDQAMRPGNILINNLVRFNYKGKIYPVNPKAGTARNPKSCISSKLKAQSSKVKERSIFL